MAGRCRSLYERQPTAAGRQGTPPAGPPALCRVGQGLQQTAFDDGVEGLAWAGWQRRRWWCRCRARGGPLEVRICGIATDKSTAVTCHPCRASSRRQGPGACPRRPALWREGWQQPVQHGGPTPPLLGAPRVVRRRGVVTGNVVVPEPAGFLGMPVAVTLGLLTLWLCRSPGGSVRRRGIGGFLFVLDLAEVPDGQGDGPGHDEDTGDDEPGRVDVEAAQEGPEPAGQIELLADQAE